MFDSTKELLDKIRLGLDSFLEEEPTPRITERSIAARSSAGAARNWRFAVVGAGFEEVEFLDASGWIELLDAVDYGGPQRSSCGPVSRRVRRGWRFLW